jgi:hypothetical protein
MKCNSHLDRKSNLVFAIDFPYRLRYIRMSIMMSLSRLLFSFLLLNAYLSFATPVQAHRTIHIFVALCDNEHQGIVPVSAELGNGDDPAHNLYWGAYYGVRSYFARSKEWSMVSEIAHPRAFVLERCVFQHNTEEVFVVADAYQGKEIRNAIVDFLNAASGNEEEQQLFILDGDTLTLNVRGSADLLAYIGHDGLMDFDIAPSPVHAEAGASPLVWTTGLLAAEAYPLKAAIDGWILNESAEQVRMRAAEAYNKYQKCGLNAAKHLFVTGF